MRSTTFAAETLDSRKRPSERIGNAKKATPAQIALAWLLPQKPWIVPIPGSRKVARLEENLGAESIENSAEELAEIDNAISAISVVGHPYQLTQKGKPFNGNDVSRKSVAALIVNLASTPGLEICLLRIFNRKGSRHQNELVGVAVYEIPAITARFTQHPTR